MLEGARGLKSSSSQKRCVERSLPKTISSDVKTSTIIIVSCGEMHHLVGDGLKVRFNGDLCEYVPDLMEGNPPLAQEKACLVVSLFPHSTGTIGWEIGGGPAVAEC